MNLGSVAAWFVFGVFGLSIFNMGRKRGQARPIVAGLLLMVYPYFVENLWLLWGVGIAILAFGIASLKPKGL